MYGRLDVLVWLHTDRPTGHTWASDLLVITVKLSQWQVAQWLVEHRPEACVDNLSRCIDIVAGNGSLPLLQQLVSLHPDAVSITAMEAVVRQGRLESVRYLHEAIQALCTRSAMETACAQGHLDVVKYLYEHCSESWAPKAMNAAATNGHAAGCPVPSRPPDQRIDRGSNDHVGVGGGPNTELDPQDLLRKKESDLMDRTRDCLMLDWMIRAFGSRRCHQAQSMCRDGRVLHLLHQGELDAAGGAESQRLLCLDFSRVERQ